MARQDAYVTTELIQLMDRAGELQHARKTGCLSAQMVSG